VVSEKHRWDSANMCDPPSSMVTDSTWRLHISQNTQRRPISDISQSLVSTQSTGVVLTRIEDIQEGIIDSLTQNRPMSITIRNRLSGNQKTLCFPSTNPAEIKKFSELPFILAVNPVAGSLLICLSPCSRAIARSPFDTRGFDLSNHYHEKVRL
jgi:hypothetical protein